MLLLTILDWPPTDREARHVPGVGLGVRRGDAGTGQIVAAELTKKAAGAGRNRPATVGMTEAYVWTNVGIKVRLTASQLGSFRCQFTPTAASVPAGDVVAAGRGSAA